MTGGSSTQLARRIDRIDPAALEAALEERGFAHAGLLLDARQCQQLASWFDDDSRYRTTIDLGARRYGDHGSYRYFAYPLPPLVASLRERLYPPLARVANRWQERFGRDARYPDTLAAFLERCHAAGQLRPTPLLLRYGAGGYNCLHQDRYGDVAFPLQVVVLLSTPGGDFEGGEFLLTEQRPRAQSRGTAVALARGHALVFPNAERPIEGLRGTFRAVSRHGVSEVRSGSRTTLGLIFHDAS